MIFHNWLETEIIPDALAWYQYQPGASAGQLIYDSIGDKHIQCALGNQPTLLTNIIAGQPAWYFDGTNDPLLWSGLVTVKHVFILASQEDATFAGYQGLLTGETLGDVLVGHDATTKFFDFGLGNFYSKEGVAFTEADQQAPVSGAFRLLEVKNGDGITLDGIQVGQQKADTSRLWKGHFVEMIVFDRILTSTEIKQVRLYFNIKFAEHTRGLPFYFPSADITPTIGPSRFYDEPEDFKAITDSWEYEDGVKDFNEVASDAPLRWEYAYPAVPKSHLPIYNEFWNQARLVNTFLFKDPDGITWDNVRIEDYNRNHEAHKRWRHDVAFRLVGYNSTGTPETPPDAAPTGLTVSPMSETSLWLTWDAPPDTEAPSVPAMTAATGVDITEITWNWNAATDDVAVTAYDLQVALDAGFSSGLVTFNLGNVLTYNHTGLAADTQYYARVRAKDAALNASAYSSSVNATTDTVPQPDDITGLVRWYKADGLVGYVDDDQITSLSDFSPSNFDATTPSAGGPKYKTNIVNSLPVMRFDGIDDRFDIGDLSSLTEGEVFVVIKLATEDAGLWTMGTAASATVFPYTGDNLIYDEFGTTVRKTTADPTPNLTTGFHIYSVYTAAGDWANHVDGTQIYTTATNTVGFPTDCEIGHSVQGINYMAGDIAEFILYDNKLSAPNRAAVIAYLEAKYGL